MDATNLNDAAHPSSIELRLLTSKQVQERLGLKNEETLAVWRSRGTFPELRWLKIGRLVRYRERDVEAFLEKHLR